MRLEVRAFSMGVTMAGLLAVAPGVGAQDAGAELAAALRDGDVDLAFRYRYELVDQAGLDADANASTLRTRLTYNSAVFRDFSLLAEMDDLRPLGADSFNSTRNGKTTRPVVADPKATDLNQFAVRYSGFTDTSVLLGRQRINRANQRFIGGVGWRQNEQTYDALSVGHVFSDRLQGYYSHVTNVNRVFGPNSGSPAGNLRTSSHLLEASYNWTPDATVTGYGYFLDFDDEPTLSNRTLGVRLTGTLAFGEDLTFPYAAEYAIQDDHANNPTGYDADYVLLEGGFRWPNFGIKLSYEILEGSGVAGRAFQTPLATLHPFQGWADKFLSTPETGIEDLYLSFTARGFGANFTVVYHDFSAEIGGADYGDEIDMSASWRLGDNYSLLLKLANYSADTFATDTEKVWVMLSASF
jgi:hypothetical protein